MYGDSWNCPITAYEKIDISRVTDTRERKGDGMSETKYTISTDFVKW